MADESKVAFEVQDKHEMALLLTQVVIEMRSWHFAAVNCDLKSAAPLLARASADDRQVWFSRARGG